jgi:hypothetical protein
MKQTNARIGLWLVRKNPRLAAKMGWKIAKHPRRTAKVVVIARTAPEMARRVGAAANDPRVQKQVRVGRDALTKAGGRLQGASSDPASAMTDEKLWSELRRAASAMAAGYAAAATPRKKRRGLKRAALAVGVIGAGAYAGFRVMRGRDDASLHGYATETEPASPVT